LPARAIPERLGNLIGPADRQFLSSLAWNSWTVVVLYH
jgi:hypothetical protein